MKIIEPLSITKSSIHIELSDSYSHCYSLGFKNISITNGPRVQFRLGLDRLDFMFLSNYVNIYLGRFLTPTCTFYNIGVHRLALCCIYSQLMVTTVTFCFILFRLTHFYLLKHAVMYLNSLFKVDSRVLSPYIHILFAVCTIPVRLVKFRYRYLS